VDVRRGVDRARTRTTEVDSRHSFSFGRHYDPTNTSFGLLLASNDEVVAPGGGFDVHEHRDVEVVTWVMAGALVHEDSTGRRDELRPGMVQALSAGSGVRHSERNAVASGGGMPVRFVQMWVVPDVRGTPPGYQRADLDADLARGGLVPVASGRAGDGVAVRIGSSAAALHVARLRRGEAVQLPPAPYVHLYLARGSAVLDGAGPLDEGDAVRVTGAAGERLTATRTAEVLVWQMHAALGG
jgi:redox-sensitive bicupin YhaK (pirin superfamily)